VPRQHGSIQRLVPTCTLQPITLSVLRPLVACGVSFLVTSVFCSHTGLCYASHFHLHQSYAPVQTSCKINFHNVCVRVFFCSKIFSCTSDCIQMLSTAGLCLDLMGILERLCEHPFHSPKCPRKEQGNKEVNGGKERSKIAHQCGILHTAGCIHSKGCKH